MNFHPYAETYPILDGAEYEAFRADIAASDGPREPVKYRLINGGSKQGLDGRNRLRACTDLEIPCPEELVQMDDEKVEAFIDSLNLHRRHLSTAQQQARRQERIQRVAAARTEGESLRSIAEKENVSQETIRQDIKEAGVKGLTASPKGGKVKGLDGSSHVATHDATHAKTEAILCPRCTRDKRVGNVMIKSCPDCKSLRNPPPKKPKSGKPVFDDRIITDLIGKLARAFDNRAAALGKNPKHADCITALDHVLSRFTQWQVES